ncbi:MAG TPA: hypothetical protein VFF30_05290 [Nitrososphaerales archaeon]|nr:hypothetical protein [Nitrososphaerales archaeon]
MKTLNFILPISLILLFAIAFAPAAFGSTPGAGSSPSNIGPDQSSMLTISNNQVFAVGAVTVTGPDGTVYKSTVCTLSTPCTGSSSSNVTLSFGTGVSGWIVTTVGAGCAGYSPALNGGANTHCNGQYEYSVTGLALARPPIFRVSANFSVPEFGVPAIMVAAVGMVLLALRSKLTSKTSIPKI